MTCIPIIFLSVLANRGILPPKIYMFITGIILIIGCVLIGLQLIDMSNRDNMNWDEYNWYFDRDNAPSNTNNETTTSNPWGTISVTCIGSACCYDGSTYDDQKNMCVPNAVYKQTQQETIETFKGLGKYANTQVKPTSLNNNIMPTFASLKF